MGNQRPLTAEDVTSEANRSYDMGRAHVKEEMRPIVDALRRLFVATSLLRMRANSQCPQLKDFSEWQKTTLAMQQAENVLPKETSAVTGVRLTLTTGDANYASHWIHV